jgi:hypothetical protein
MAGSMTVPQLIVVAAAVVSIQTWGYFSWIKLSSCHSGSSRNGYMENTLSAHKKLICYLIYKMYWSENEYQWPCAEEYLQGYSETSKVIFMAIFRTAGARFTFQVPCKLFVF